MKNANIHFAPVKVVARMNGEGKPVAFLVDTVRNGTIKALVGNSRDMQTVGLDYYRHTSPAENEQAAQLVKKLRRLLPEDQQNLTIRSRLPRGYKEMSAMPEKPVRKSKSDVAKERYKNEVAATGGQLAQPEKRKYTRKQPQASSSTAQAVPENYVTLELFNAAVESLKQELRALHKPVASPSGSKRRAAVVSKKPQQASITPAAPQPAQDKK